MKLGVKVDGQDLTLAFGLYGEGGRRVVTADVLYNHGDHDHVVARGMAICTPEDVENGMFSVERGQRMALSRALRSGGAPREVRQEIDRQYTAFRDAVGLSVPTRSQVEDVLAA